MFHSLMFYHQFCRFRCTLVRFNSGIHPPEPDGPSVASNNSSCIQILGDLIITSREINIECSPMLEEVFQRLGQLVVQKKDSIEFQIRIILFFKDCLNKIDQFNEIILNCDVIGMIGNIMLHSGLVYMHDS